MPGFLAGPPDFYWDLEGLRRRFPRQWDELKQMEKMRKVEREASNDVEEEELLEDDGPGDAAALARPSSSFRSRIRLRPTAANI